MKRFHLLYLVPAMALLVSAVLPLALGTRTLYLRDVLTTHYPLKAAQAQALQEGRFPLVDIQRAGGQPLAGNLNAVPFYPTNLLYLVASPLWALNAHFWIHWLLAPFLMAWLGRAWGLGRAAAWGAGVCYAASGYFLSQLNFYNAVAGAALAPAFIAASLDAWRSPRRLPLLAVALLWALLILSGDPTIAVLAAAMAGTAGLVRFAGLPSLRWVVSVGLGTGLALPQIVEMVRILPLSLRGYGRFSEASALIQSWDPRTILELFLPLFFGGPDFAFWGQRYFGGLPPLFFSLFPGVLVLCLIFLAGRPLDRRAAWAWGTVGVGLFLALGSFNPVVRWLYGLPGGSLLRFPVKLWLVVAVAGALLAGIGCERLLAGGGKRRFLCLLALLGAAYLTCLGIVVFGWPASVLDAMAQLEPERLVGATLKAERARWAALCLVALVTILLLGLAAALLRRRPFVAVALMVVLHLASQLRLLAPLYEADDAEPYGRRPELLEVVSDQGLVVHGGSRDLFGSRREAVGEIFPDLRTLWLARAHFGELYPFSGIPWGLRYAFNHSPEGLDSFYTVAMVQALRAMDDPSRLRILAASGVHTLLLDRPLNDAARPLAEPLGTARGALHTLTVYRVLDAAPEVQLLRERRFAPHLNAARRMLASPDFDPLTMVVLAGDGPPSVGPGGRLEVLSSGPESLEVATTSAGEGTLLVQRAFLPIYRATIDGQPAQLEVGNMHRLALRLPAGEHRVHIWVDRRPLWISCGAALLAAVGLWVLWSRSR